MENKSSKSITWVIIAVSLAITIVAVYILFNFDNRPNPTKSKNTINNKEEVTLIGGDFELIDHNGEKFSSDTLKGKLSLIYFGFTYCPDVCPESLNKLSRVLDTLDKYNIDVNVVFITIDPNRDTQKVIKEYLGHFHSKIVGLIGSESEIKEVADKFKVYYARGKNSSPGAEDYMMDHTTFIYLMDKDGKYLQHFYGNSTAEEMVEVIRVNNQTK